MPKRKSPDAYEVTPELVMEISHVEDIDDSEFIHKTGKIITEFNGEKHYQAWLLEHIEILKQVIGIEGNGMPLVDKVLKPSNYRPDLMFEMDNELIIVEIKCCRNRYTTQNVVEQIRSIGQVLMYQQISHRPTRIFLIDNCIHFETMQVIRNNDLPIGVIEANERHFAIMR